MEQDKLEVDTMVRVAHILHAGILCGAMALLGACSDPSAKGESEQAVGKAQGLVRPTISTDPAVAAIVPADLKAKGELVIATNAPYAPLEYFDTDNRTLIGYDIDLGNAIAKTMGLKATWKNMSFDSIMPGIQAGKYDAAMAGFSIEHERLQSVDFVSYYLTGGAFMIRKGSGIRAGSFESLCGIHVAVLKGASQVHALEDASEVCERTGKQPIEISQLADQNVITLNLKNRRVDVVAGDKPQLEYAARNTDGVCVAAIYQTNHSIGGIAIAKDQRELRDAFQAAVTSLLKSGAIKKISAYWGTGVARKGSVLSPEYAKVAEEWGIGPDGTLQKSLVFTDPKQIRDGHQFFYQPINEECVKPI